MKIILVGCGKTGSNIAEQLCNEKHDITVIDSNSEKVMSITNRLDVMGIVGNGASVKTLKEAGIADAELMIAVTNQDEINLLSCLFARQASKCSTIARVRTPHYREEIGYIKEELGLSLILNPEHDSAMEIARILRFPSANKIDTFAKGRVELVRFTVNENSPIVDKTLNEVSRFLKLPILIGFIKHGEEVFIPNGSSVLHAGDTVGVLGMPVYIKQFFSKIGHETHQVKNAIIAGAGKTAFYLANMLINSGIHVTIIDKDRNNCEFLSTMLPKANVICGDATNEELMLEEGIEKAESFVALTPLDESNIFLSLYAKKVSKAKVITKINHIDHNDIVKNFNLDSIITPKNVSADMVVSYVRARQNTIGSNVETLYRIVDNSVEALEFKIRKGAPVIGVPLMNLKIKEGILVSCVNKGGNQMIIPNGQTVIEEGDKVIVITTSSGLGDIKDILKN